MTREDRIEKMMTRSFLSAEEAEQILEQYSDEEIENGYGIFLDEGVVPGACSINILEDLSEYLPCSTRFLDDFKKKGGKIIENIPTDVYYIDTEENRNLVETYFNKHYCYTIEEFRKLKCYRYNTSFTNRYRVVCEDGFSMDVKCKKTYTVVSNISPRDPSVDGVSEYFIPDSAMTKLIRDHKGIVRDISEQRYFFITEIIDALDIPSMKYDILYLKCADGACIELFIKEGLISQVSILDKDGNIIRFSGSIHNMARLDDEIRIHSGVMKHGIDHR